MSIARVDSVFRSRGGGLLASLAVGNVDIFVQLETSQLPNLSTTFLHAQLLRLKHCSNACF
jgi:hypothetical protein